MLGAWLDETPPLSLVAASPPRTSGRHRKSRGGPGSAVPAARGRTVTGRGPGPGLGAGTGGVGGRPGGRSPLGAAPGSRRAVCWAPGEGSPRSGPSRPGPSLPWGQRGAGPEVPQGGGGGAGGVRSVLPAPASAVWGVHPKITPAA